MHMVSKKCVPVLVQCQWVPLRQQQMLSLEAKQNLPPNLLQTPAMHCSKEQQTLGVRPYKMNSHAEPFRCKRFELNTEDIFRNIPNSIDSSKIIFAWHDSVDLLALTVQESRGIYTVNGSKKVSIFVHYLNCLEN